MIFGNIITKKAKESIKLIAKRTWGTEQIANQSFDKINAGNWSNPAPPPEIAENVLEKKDIKNI